MIKNIFSLIFLFACTFGFAQTVSVVIEDCVTAGNKTVKVKYMANGDFMASNGTDDWASQTITLQWNPACLPGVTTPVAPAVDITGAGSLPFTEGFGGTFFMLSDIGGVDDGFIYSTYTAPSMDDVVIADGMMIVAFEIDIPDTWAGGNAGTPGVADGCISLLTTQPQDMNGVDLTTNLAPVADNNGTGGNTWDGMGATSDLPVELLEFNATAENSFIGLDWKTATEENAEGFEIGRSTNGKDFEKIGWIPASGNSLTELAYAYKDLAVKSGVEYYYQLKMVDNDGTVDYSEVRQASLNGKTTGVSVYPNPVQDFVNVSVDVASADENVRVYVYDMLGKVVLSSTKDLDEGSNFFQLNVADLPTGTYQLIVEGTQVREVKNIVVMEN